MTDVYLQAGFSFKDALRVVRYVRRTLRRLFRTHINEFPVEDIPYMESH